MPAEAYRPRRPAATLLHRTVREHLETYLARAGCDDDLRPRVPPHVQQAFHAYLRCGILAHGFARAYCHGCGHDFLIAFSCKGRDICPSCAARRMVETAGHLVDQVLPRVGYRQWVLSVPKRVRWHLREKPEAASGLLRVFLRAVDASVSIPDWDRHGLERLVRYCARPPLAQQRLGRLGDEHLVYRLRKPTVDGRTELILTPLQLLDRLASLVTPPRVHKHRYCGVLAPNARLRRAVTATAGPAGATLQILEQAREKMGLAESETSDTGPRPLSSDEGERRSLPGRIAARCWALLLARIFEYLPLVCPHCQAPMRLIAFILDPPVIERILGHIGEPTEAPAVLSARSPPQGELSFGQVDGEPGAEAWPEIDQTGGGDGWE